MKTCIALFRGINVGSSRVLSMKSLVAALEAIGCTGVRTYVQSGNAVVRSGATQATRLAARIRRAVDEQHGFEPDVLVLAPAELECALAANPFPQAASDPKSLHRFFLAEAPQRPDLEAMHAAKATRESFALAGKFFPCTRRTASASRSSPRASSVASASRRPRATCEPWRR